MYYPVQIPFALNKEYSRYMEYRELPAYECEQFVVCFWEMQSKQEERLVIDNVIVSDACIDLVVDFDARTIDFAGMSKTEFHFHMELPTRSFGARMMPGAFYQLTGLPATHAMDVVLPLEEVFSDFDQKYFFALSLADAQMHFQKYVVGKFQGIEPDMFTRLFSNLVDGSLQGRSVKERVTLSGHILQGDIEESLLVSTTELADILGFSPRQCQRLFMAHYGISPKMALSIMRFHKCLGVLVSSDARPIDILYAMGYYDQSHFIKDFRRYLGITPQELIQHYRAQ